MKTRLTVELDQAEVEKLSLILSEWAADEIRSHPETSGGFRDGIYLFGQGLHDLLSEWERQY